MWLLFYYWQIRTPNDRRVLQCLWNTLRRLFQELLSFGLYDLLEIIRKYYIRISKIILKMVRREWQLPEPLQMVVLLIFVTHLQQLLINILSILLVLDDLPLEINGPKLADNV